MYAVPETGRDGWLVLPSQRTGYLDESTRYGASEKSKAANVLRPSPSPCGHVNTVNRPLLWELELATRESVKGLSCGQGLGSWRRSAYATESSDRCTGPQRQRT